jgi:hypothetical protein
MEIDTFCCRPTATGLAIPSNTFTGWFIGGGTEYTLTGILPFNGLFWRTEHRYSQFQDAELAINCYVGGPLRRSWTHELNRARAATSINDNEWLGLALQL